MKTEILMLIEDIKYQVTLEHLEAAKVLLDTLKTLLEKVDKI